MDLFSIDSIFTENTYFAFTTEPWNTRLVLITRWTELSITQFGFQLQAIVEYWLKTEPIQIQNLTQSSKVYQHIIFIAFHHTSPFNNKLDLNSNKFVIYKSTSP